MNQVLDQRRHSINLSSRPAIFDRDVLTFDIAGLLEALSLRGIHVEEGTKVLGVNYDTGERYLSVDGFLPVE